jgi:RNA polymerase sigma factor (sigma-70 family)
MCRYVSIRAGLTDAEAQDVVQDTVLTVAKNLKDFKANPAFGSFKAWLLKTTRWRIINQFNKRRPDQLARHHRPPDDTRQTATAERIPDQRDTELTALWDSEWEDYVVGAALERLKEKVKPKHYQVFFLHAIKGQSVRDVGKALGLPAAQVYLLKHRLTPLFRQEVSRLAQQLG